MRTEQRTEKSGQLRLRIRQEGINQLQITNKTPLVSQGGHPTSMVAELCKASHR